eukprot:Clim_evm171s157 gene=Clim_evmTU171s157
MSGLESPEFRQYGHNAPITFRTTWDLLQSEEANRYKKTVRLSLFLTALGIFCFLLAISLLVSPPGKGPGFWSALALAFVTLTPGAYMTYNIIKILHGHTGYTWGQLPTIEDS